MDDQEQDAWSFMASKMPRVLLKRKLRPTDTSEEEVPQKLYSPKTLLECCFEYVGTHTQQVSGIYLPDELCNRLFVHLVKRKKLNATNIAWILERNNMKTLFLGHYVNLSVEGLMHVSVCGPNLEGLMLNGCFRVTNEIVDHILESCVNIKHLDLSITPVDSSIFKIAGIKGRNLNTLLLRNCKSIRGDAFVSIPNLTKIELAGCCNITEITFKCPLEVIDLGDCKKLERISWDSSYQTLTKLNCWRCLNLQNDSLSEFLKAGGSKLKELNLLECLRVRNALSQLSDNLSYLIISDCDLVDDEIIESIAKKCTSIKSLYMSSCVKITNASIVKLRSCSQLENISFCPNITDDGLIPLVSSLHALRNIDLTDNKQISNQVPYTIILSCPNLYALSLCSCSNLDDGAFSLLLEEKIQGKVFASELQNLNLSQVPISDISLKAIASVCPKLSALDLTSCAGSITDEGLGAVLKGCPGLKRLGLQFCRMLTDRTLINISQHSELLQYLDTYGCEMLTLEGYKKVIICCKNLLEFDVGSKVLSDLDQWITNLKKSKEFLTSHPNITRVKIFCSRVADL